jgi:copper chaperone CopZ
MSLTTIRIGVSGMTCGNCARMVERKLASSPGVAKAQVDLDAAAATVEYDPARVSTEELAAAIEKLGYQVSR